MEISKMLTLSTAHITKETADKLDLDCKPVSPEDYWQHSFCFDLGLSIFPKDDFGWFLWIPSADRAALPDDLKQCIELALANGCDWLCLDSDGLIEKSLKTYEWEE